MAKTKGKDKKKATAKAKPVKKASAKPAAKKAKPAAKKQTAKPVKKAAPKPAKKAAKPAKKAAVKAKPVKKVAPKKKAVAKKPIAKVVKKAAKPVKKVLAKNVSKPKPVAAKPVKVAKPVAKPAKAKTQPTKPAPLVKQSVVSSAKPMHKQPTMTPADPNAPQLRYSDEELKEFKDLIDKKLSIARDELKSLKEALDNHTESQAGNKAWNMEEGTDTTEMEYLMNQISRQHGYIRNLELALVRIENKTYGICRASGKLIPKERLRVVPHATLSLEAKMSRKKEDDVPSAGGNAAPPTDFSEGFEE